MATIEELLRKLAADKLAEGRNAQLPEPANSMSLGPLSTNTTAAQGALNPEPPLPRIVQPAAPDMDFVNQYAGPEPVRPVERKPSKLEILAGVLQGVGAGFQGRGGEFVESIRQQREAPQRRFEAEQQSFQSRRLRGLEIARDDAERQADRVNKMVAAQYENDFQVWLKRTGVRDETSKAAMRQVYDLEQIRERERVQDERLLKEQRLAFSRDIARQVQFYKSSGVADATQARRLALNDFADVAAGLGVTVPALTPADSRRLLTVQARLDRQQRAGSGGAGASRREEQDLQKRISQAAAGVAGMEKLARQAMENPEDKRAPILNQMRSMAATLQAQFGELVEVGEHNGWPFARLRRRGAGQQPQQQQQQPKSDPLGLFK